MTGAAVVLPILRIQVLSNIIRVVGNIADSGLAGPLPVDRNSVWTGQGFVRVEQSPLLHFLLLREVDTGVHVLR